MIAKVTQRTELGPLRALPTVRRARIERGMRLSLAQCAQLTPDFMWDRDFRSGCASRVAMMQSADHREGDALPPIGGLALAIRWMSVRIFVSLGRLVLRFTTASCRRKARFSSASSRCGFRLDRAVASRTYSK